MAPVMRIAALTWFDGFSPPLFPMSLSYLTVSAKYPDFTNLAILALGTRTQFHRLPVVAFQS
jgi:hypothetical protein